MNAPCRAHRKSDGLSQLTLRSIACRRCDGRASLIRREPLPVDVEGEMLTFKCEKCGKESKTIVQA
jgi:DNA-directed RNA polymerase subunit RPC12/RpoP